MEFRGIFPERLTRKKVKNKKNKIDLPTFDLTDELRAEKTTAFREEKRVE